MVRLGGFKRMGKKSAPASNDVDRPLQTPTAGSLSPNPPTEAGVSSSNLKLEDVPVSGRASPMKSATPAGPSMPTSTATVDTQKTKEIMGKVEGATKTMEQNIQAATQRGENLDELQDKTQAVAESSKQFSKNAKTVKKNLWWKNMKFTLIVVFIVICLLVGFGVLMWLQTRS